MYVENIATAIERMPVNEIRDFILEKYYKRTGFSNKNSYYQIKRFKKDL